MPPPNDNFANAQTLDPVQIGIGAGGGSNIGATFEVGEPLNSGKTVWYKITPTANFVGPLEVRTIHNTLAAPLRTILQAFIAAPGANIPPLVTQLQEVSYVAAFKTAYGGWDFGSLIAFEVITGKTYYIRVDGVAGVEGRFPLNYGTYFNLRLGSCGKCSPVFGVGYTCIGFTGSDYVPAVGGRNTLGFGANAFPRGRYRVRYCGGALSQHDNDPNFPPGGGTVWSVDNRGNAEVALNVWNVYFNGADPSHLTLPGITNTTQRARASGIATITDPGHSYQTGQRITSTGIGGFGYNLTSVAITVIDANHFSFASPGANEATTADTGGIITPINLADWTNLIMGDEVAEFPSPAAAENGNRCAFAAFDHLGGNIIMTLDDASGSGSPNPPAWGLYSITPFIQLATSPACASWNGSGPGASSVSFQIHNLNDVDWDLVSATLQVSGGVTAPGTVTNILLTRQTNTKVTIPFTSADLNVTATLVLTCPFWPTPFSFTVFLGPIFQVDSTIGPYLDQTVIAGIVCNGKKVYDFNLILRNLGYWAFNTAQITFNASATNGALVGPYNTGFVIGPHGRTQSTKCPTATNVALPIIQGVDCNDVFYPPIAALLCPAGASAPVATVLTLTLATNGGAVIFTHDFPIIVPL